jgi:hypothetical protein
MIANSRRRDQTTKGRLESGFRTLETVLLCRLLIDSPDLGSGIERAIIDRELRELEWDLRLSPPFQPGEGLRTPHNTRADGNQERNYRS